MHYRTEAEARTAGQVALAKMSSPAIWRLDVWNNLGWHWCLQSHPVTLYPYSPTYYYAMITAEPSPGGGSPYIGGTDAPVARQPQRAVDNAVKKVEAKIAEYNTLAHLLQEKKAKPCRGQHSRKSRTRNAAG